MKTLLKKLWRLTENVRLMYLMAILATLLASLFLFSVPYIIKSAFDLVGNKELSSPLWGIDQILLWRDPSDTFGGGVFGKLAWAGLLTVLFTAVASFFTFLHGRLASLSSETVAKTLRDKLFDHIQKVPCRDLEGMETGDLVQRCTSDVETLRVFLADHLTTLARSTLTVVVAVVIMLPLGLVMTIASTALLPLVIIFSLMYFSKVRSCFKDVDEAEADMTGCIQENLSGIRVVRAFANQESEIIRFSGKNQEYRKRWYHLIKIMSAYWAVSNLLVFGQRAICLAVGGWMLCNNEAFGTGDFMAFLVFVSLVLWPVQRLGRVMADMGKASVSVARIFDVLGLPEEENVVDPITDIEVAGEVEFRDLVFAHQEATVLNNVSFKVMPGEIVAIVGPSGSGKTTLVDLMLRFYDVDNGEILLDGNNINSFDREILRSSIGVVRQSPFIFSRSVRDNIVLSKSSASEAEMHQASGVAALHETVNNFADGYDTIVGEKGVTLSGGQRQRIALAREILRDPPVLILDDGLSAVDAATETDICDALSSRRGRRTTIVIAHRLSTLRLADKVLVLEDGEVTQYGSPKELAQQDGLYRKLCEIQYDIEQSLVDDSQEAGEV